MNVLRKTLYLSVLLLFATCKNDDDTPPIEQLPEATQTGRGVFGCLVDGEAFVETGTFFNTFYQNIDGEFFFGLQADFDDRDPFGISLSTKMRAISEGETLVLMEREDGNASAGVIFTESFNNLMLSTTDEINTGTLTITKLDFESKIVSGTFAMNVINPFNGEIVEITDGRFDTLFTQ